MKHFSERLDQRILSQSELPVSYETTIGNYTKVGTIKINDLIKNQIKQIVTDIENTNFPTNKDYAIKVTQFPLSTTKFDSEIAKSESYGKQLVVSLTDDNGESNGNEIYCIVRGGTITTFCFVKSYTGYGDLETKLRVDGIIKNLKNLKK
jgi:hypothetical protein